MKIPIWVASVVLIALGILLALPGSLLQDGLASIASSGCGSDLPDGAVCGGVSTFVVFVQLVGVGLMLFGLALLRWRREKV